MECLRDHEYPWEAHAEEIRKEFDAFYDDDYAGLIGPLVESMIRAAERCLEEPRVRALQGPLARRPPPAGASSAARAKPLS